MIIRSSQVIKLTQIESTIKDLKDGLLKKGLPISKVNSIISTLLA